MQNYVLQEPSLGRVAVLAFPDSYADGVFTNMKSQGHISHLLSEVMSQNRLPNVQRLSPSNGGYYYTNFDLYCQCEAAAVPLHGILCLDVTQFSVTNTNQTILVFDCNITHLFYRISSNRLTVLVNDSLHSIQAFIWRERRSLYFKLNITAVCVKIVERGGM